MRKQMFGSALGTVTLSPDGQSVEVVGKHDIYTIKVGETYVPKPSQISTGVYGTRSNVTVAAFIPADTTHTLLAVVNYTKADQRQRQQSAVQVKVITQNYSVPSVKRPLPVTKPAKPASIKGRQFELEAQLLAQVVTDVAEIRARVSALENLKGGSK